MGLSLRPLKRLYEAVTPQNEEALRRANASIEDANRQIAAGGSNNYGVLGARDAINNFIASQQKGRFNLPRATFSAYQEAKPVVAKQTANFAVNMAREFPKGIVRIRNTGPETIRTGNPMLNAGLEFLKKPAGFDRKITANGPELTPNNRFNKRLYGTDPIKNAPQDFQDISKGLTGKQAPAPVALVGGLLLNAPGTGPLKGAKGAAKTSKAIDDVPPKPVVTAKVPEPPRNIGQEQIQAAKQQKNAYKQNTVKKVADTVRRELVDPYNIFARYDRKYAKQTGQDLEKLSAQGRTMPELIQNFRYVTNQQGKAIYKKRSTGDSVADVIKRYGEDTPQGNEFVNNLNNRFTVEVFEKTGKNIQGNANIDDIRRTVADYEARNPRAAVDARTVKEHSDDLLEYASKTGLIDDETAKFVQSNYQNYAPLSRVLPDDLITGQYSGGVAASVGKQKVLQSLEGSSNPLDTTFGTIISRTGQAIKQANINKFDNELLKRNREGNFGNLLVDPEVSLAYKAKREEFKSLVSDMQKQMNSRRAMNSKQRVNRVGIKQAEAEAISRARTILRREVTDPDAQAAISALKPKELREIFETMMKQDDTAGFTRVMNKLKKRDARYASLGARIENLNARINQTAEQKDAAFNQALGLRQDPTTGKQIIQGQYKGEKFAIEVPPDFADGLAALNATDQRNVLNHIAQFPADVQKALYTGAFAPIFTAVNVLVKNQAMMFGNARRLTPYGARAIAQGFAAALKKGIRPQLEAHGFIPEVATQAVNDSTLSATLIASRAGIKQFASYTIRHPGMAAKDLYHGLNQFGAILGNMQRTQIGAGAYYNALRRGFSEEEALKLGAQAANEVLGNFNRVSQAARLAEPVFLYAGATQSGIRSTGRALRARPVETAAKYSAIAVGLGASSSALLSSDKGQQFVSDLLEAGNGYILDGNMVFLSPTAEKDEKTGEWKGVWKVPIPPDLRPLNRAIQRELYAKSQGRDVNPVNFAKEAFNYISGGYFAEDRPSSEDHNPNLEERGRGIGVGNLLENNPTYKIMQTTKNNIDPYAGKPFEVSETKNTTDAARGFANVYNKIPGLGDITPAQADAILQQGGLTGKIIQDKQGRGPAGTVVKTLSDQFKNAKGQNNYGKFLASEDKIIKEVGLNKDELAAYSSVHPHRKDAMGESLNEKTPYDSADRAVTYMRYPKLLEVDRRKDAERRSEGKTGDPMFDLSPERLRTVLNIQASRLSPGNKEVAATYKLNPWLKDFDTQRSAYFDDLFSESGKEQSTTDAFGLKYPKMSAGLESKQERLNKMTDKAQRAQFYADNPDLTEHYREQDKYQAEKRRLLGLPAFDPYPEAPPQTKALMDQYNKLPKGDGKRGGSPTRSAFLKAHPEIVKEWDRKARYDLANAGALAVYEGIDFNADDVKDMSSIARNADPATGGFNPGAAARGGGKDPSGKARNPYAYAISPNAGGSIPKPKVTVRRTAVKSVAKKVPKKTKIKVKKSKV